MKNSFTTVADENRLNQPYDSNFRQRWARFSRRALPYVLIAPTLVVLLVFLVFPIIQSLVFSLHRFNLLRPGARKFVGFENYLDVFSSDLFWKSFLITIIFTVVSVALEFTIGLALALVLNRPLHGRRLIRTIILLPFFATPTVVALSWKLILNTEFGVGNYFLSVLGLSPQNWLGPGLALPSLIMVEIWQHTSFIVLILLAGLQALPQEAFEAAIIDGANSWQQLTKIALPLLKPVILVALIFRTMFTLRIFDTIWVLTGGGPANETRTFSIGIYLTGFRQFDIGAGATLSWILLLVTMVFSLVYWRYLSTDVEL